MAVNRGKNFENVIRKAFEAVDNTSVIRLPDPVQGYLGYRNICDFIVYHYPHQFFIECKSVHGNRLSIYSPDPKKKYGAITNNQWEGMRDMAKCKGIIAGVICWWVEKDITKFLPIQLLEYYRNNGLKSVAYNCLNSQMPIKEFIVDVPGRKKRVFFEYDMSLFLSRCTFC